MSSIITLIEQFFHDKQLGHSSIDRDFSTLQETNNKDLENRVLSAKKGKGLLLQREQHTSKIVILLDVNANLCEHYKGEKQNNPICDIINAFSSDYIVSIQTVDCDITSNWYEYIDAYSSTIYASSINRIIKKANEIIQDGSIPIVISDFLECSFELNDLICIQIKLPIFSSLYHGFYADMTLPLQSNYLYVW